MCRILFCLMFLFSMAFSMEATGEPNNQLITLQTILDAKELIVGMHKTDYPPFYLKKRRSTIGDVVYGVIESNNSDDNPFVLVGQDVDLAEGLGAKLGVKVRYVREATRFDDLVSDLVDGKTHVVISHLSDTARRRQIVDFSDTYLETAVCLMASPIRLKQRTDALEIKELVHARDFNQEFVTIIAREGSSHAATAKQAFAKASVVTVLNTSYEPIMASIEKGSFYATIGDELVMNILLTRSPEARKTLQLYPILQADYDELGLENKNDKIGIAIQKGSTELRDFINEYLKTVPFTPDDVIQYYVIDLKY